MKIILDKKPKHPIIIEGFPGFGLVGTIAIEFLIEHLKTEQIGKLVFDEMQAMVAIHEGSVVEPLGIFYNKEYNIMLLHAITASKNHEWQIADMLNNLAKQLAAKELICLEGVGSGSYEEIQEEGKVFYYTNNDKKKRIFEKINVPQLKEGVIIGVTGAALLRVDSVTVSCLFAETHMQLPDSKAAAKIIEFLDKYIGLKVNYKPLLVQAQKFEEKLKTIMRKSEEVKDISERKKLSYVG